MFNINIGDAFYDEERGPYTVEGFVHYGPCGWFGVCVDQDGETFDMDIDTLQRSEEDEWT